jgi:pSer/pThr/pTyr-binding forkhead associated (FHA) protein
LSEGEHIIGREVGADLQLDATTVSRRHARVIVRDGHVRLEDLGSKNGTFRAADRVTTAVPLLHGDVVHIGALTLTLRLRQPFAPTETAI